VDSFLPTGYTKEEMKMENEGRKIMHHAKFRASVTCVRVPVYRSHSVAVSAEFDKPVSVDAARGVSTGISAPDRSHTIRLLGDPTASAADFVQPGHVFPLRARPGGVLARRGHTEASVDLARLAGRFPAAAICEVMADDGEMMRLPALREYARRHALSIVSIADLVAYREADRARGLRAIVTRGPETLLPSSRGTFRVRAYTDPEGHEHLALVMGKVDARTPILTRLHSECLTGDVFGSRRCDCGSQMRAALAAMADVGSGVLLYLRQEGRGIGLAAKMRTYALQDAGLDTVEANQRLGYSADGRDYRVAAAMLADLGLGRVRLLTNNPAKVRALTDAGIEVVERVPIQMQPTAENIFYLRTKRAKLGHELDLDLDFAL
jgi:3,4-dihydroxy 2-butanone 4-phosphate synthase/GTP cyclohydrolase II